ncbi:hypothetical protein M8C21_033018 [Ambrosia artemisiifolia]|uniref:RRM domain-containing protein n=1 Tax=Ambrosia artemisiifolia TaxID=4212 RepID=A0AAD5GB10_AMBAR|nr:hypothetical protein M8C21_033018 [Ambrosia artemisiifolia]
MRGRSYSYSPSPPRYRSRSYRSPSPRGRYAGRAKDLPTSLLVRNLGRGCRPEDLRGPFGEFGPLKDVYLPRDYYTGEPRGFGFVQYVDPDDAAEAKYHMDGQVLLGRELTVVFAEENRKKPSEMRAREREFHMTVEDHPAVILVHQVVGGRTIAVQVTILLPLGGAVEGHTIAVQVTILLPLGGAVEGHTIAVQVTILLLLGGAATLVPLHPETEDTERGLIQGAHIGL